MVTATALAVVAVSGCTINVVAPGGSSASPPPPALGTPAAASAPPSPSAPSTATARDWSAVAAEVRSGVVRLQVVGCDGSWTGSGFLVDDDLVVTAAHVARGASSVSVTSEAGVVRGEVVDLDLSADTALLRLRRPLAGHRFTVAAARPDLGVDVGVLGYPFGVDDVRLSRGAVSSGDTRVRYEGEDGFTVDHVVTTDAAVNGGNSGGPAVDREGVVVGLVSGNSNWSGDPNEPVPAQGNNFLVPSDVVHDRVEEWSDERGTRTTACSADDDAPVAADFDLDVGVDSEADDADDIALALYLHGDSINQGFYDAAWSLFTPRLQARFDGVEGWSDGLSSSYWTQLVVRRVDRDGRTADARVDLRTRQDAADGFRGQTCSDWSMRYRMRLVGGAWLIDDADAGAGPTSC
ncbi:S1C family serine protease [Microlunatus capsulatus]|uniref:Trypsin-like peptidase domain-containing protein n=1 Tax=Microlunatus capsulatus TaxID=99117 RepID=A0ABS4ZBZ9_9ACTN|nr:serine protease [Microlunatus capsulatus]MBP2418235.1 hypothetical protein [Microlunatus capsulatus]